MAGAERCEPDPAAFPLSSPGGEHIYFRVPFLPYPPPICALFFAFETVLRPSSGRETCTSLKFVLSHMPSIAELLV